MTAKSQNRARSEGNPAGSTTYHEPVTVSPVPCPSVCPHDVACVQGTGDHDGCPCWYACPGCHPQLREMLGASVAAEAARRHDPDMVKQWTRAMANADRVTAEAKCRG